jgi:flagellar basal-body rod modification protein FlgD
MVNSISTNNDPSVLGSQVPSSPNDPNSNLASEQTFLKLFVAQLQNQDPLNPNQQDPTQMVSELAQFSQLEQLVNIGAQTGSIDKYLTGTDAAAPASSSSTTAHTATGQSNNNQTGASQSA